MDDNIVSQQVVSVDKMALFQDEALCLVPPHPKLILYMDKF